MSQEIDKLLMTLGDSVKTSVECKGFDISNLQNLKDEQLLSLLREHKQALHKLGIKADIGGHGIIYGAMRHPYEPQPDSDNDLTPMQQDTTLRITPINCMAALLYQMPQIAEWEREQVVNVYQLITCIAYEVKELFQKKQRNKMETAG